MIRRTGCSLETLLQSIPFAEVILRIATVLPNIFFGQANKHTTRRTRCSFAIPIGLLLEELGVVVKTQCGNWQFWTRKGLPRLLVLRGASKKNVPFMAQPVLLDGTIHKIADP